MIHRLRRRHRDQQTTWSLLRLSAPASPCRYHRRYPLDLLRTRDRPHRNATSVPASTTGIILFAVTATSVRRIRFAPGWINPGAANRRAQKMQFRVMLTDNCLALTDPMINDRLRARDTVAAPYPAVLFDDRRADASVGRAQPPPASPASLLNGYWQVVVVPAGSPHPNAACPDCPHRPPPDFPATAIGYLRIRSPQYVPHTIRWL